MRKLIISISILVLVVIVFVVGFGKRTDGKLKVTFIDVGNADSILVEMPDGKVALVDGGETQNLWQVHNTLFEKKIKKIDFLINTHQHTDHIGSFSELMKVYKVGKVYMPKSTIENEQLDKMLKEVENRNIPLEYIKRGFIIYDNEVKLEVLSPYIDSMEIGENNFSAVLLLTHKENTFLLTADAGGYLIKSLIYDYDLGECDVVKASHHGADDSNDYTIYEKLKPEYVVVSVSDDENREPSRLLKICESLDITCFTTYECGNIEMVSEGNNIDVKKEKTPIK